MRFPAPLIEARLVRRYKRFLADVELAGGAVVTVHCANPGAMLGLAEPGMRVLLSRSDKPDPQAAALVGTGRGRRRPGRHQHRPPQPPGRGGDPRRRASPSLPATTAFAARWPTADSRGSTSCSRRDGRPDAYVEVKNVHLSRAPGLAEFPDSVTARGARHLDELSAMVAAGHRAVMVYLVQRGDSARFRHLPRHRPGLCRRLRPGARGRRRDAGLWLPHHRRRRSPSRRRFRSPVDRREACIAGRKSPYARDGDE